MKILRLRSTVVRPAAAVAYTAGDEISNHATAGSVVRATFSLAGFRQGRITSAELDLTPASGNTVTPASNFDLLVFRTGEQPGAVGDNVTNPISAAVQALAVAGFRFDDTGWTDPRGGSAAGTSHTQDVMPTIVQPLVTPVVFAPWYPGFPFSLADRAAVSLTAVLRALGAWTPGAVINTFGITLNIEAE